MGSYIVILISCIKLNHITKWAVWKLLATVLLFNILALSSLFFPVSRPCSKARTMRGLVGLYTGVNTVSLSRS